MRLKHGVNVSGIRSEMMFALMAANDAFGKHGYTITSALDGKHSRASLHYVGAALDFRTKHVPEEEHPLIRNQMAVALGEQFDVVLEANHIHVEFQPKR